MVPSDKPVSYRDAGVDIDAGDAFVEAIKPIARSTRREGCVDGLGGFGALFEVPRRYRDPLLVSSTDGVGTKLKLAIQSGRHDTIGIDLVAMCVNDILVQGAEPLFFLDYFATSKLDPDIASQVVAGIGAGCRQAGAALIGGETAEMPGMYAPGDYDLAGFCVGAVERESLIDGSKVSAGDVLLGIASSGPHANGYSLIRKLLKDRRIDVDRQLAGAPLIDHLLAPTRIYVKSLLRVLDALPIKALAHITGGGLPGNIKRVLPHGTRAIIDQGTWDWPPIMQWLQAEGNVTQAEMYRTFNCGVGMVMAVPPEVADTCLALLHQLEEHAWQIGLVENQGGAPTVLIQ